MVRQQSEEGWYLKDDSLAASATSSKSPTYPAHPSSIATAKL